MAMVKTFSVRYDGMLLEQTRTMKASAASYIEDIKERGILWSNLQWTDASECLPLGLVLSHQILLSR